MNLTITLTDLVSDARGGLAESARLRAKVRALFDECDNPAVAPTPEQITELVGALEQYLQAGHKEARQIASVRAKAALIPFRKS